MYEDIGDIFYDDNIEELTKIYNTDDADNNIDDIDFDEMGDYDETEDLEEIKRTKIKNDKVFNNRYKVGEGFREDGDYDYQSSIAVNHSYSDNYLKDVYDYEETLDYNIGVSKIFELMKEDPKLNKLLKKLDKNERIKLSREEINDLFNDILKLIDPKKSGNNFYSPIYILEAISALLTTGYATDPIKDYKKIFDCLDVYIQEDLIIELNKKYSFLDGKMNRGKIH
jgi:hypothetical protein